MDQNEAVSSTDIWKNISRRGKNGYNDGKWRTFLVHSRNNEENYVTELQRKREMIVEMRS